MSKEQLLYGFNGDVNGIEFYEGDKKVEDYQHFNSAMFYTCGDKLYLQLTAETIDIDFENYINDNKSNEVDEFKQRLGSDIKKFTIKRKVDKVFKAILSVYSKDNNGEDKEVLIPLENLIKKGIKDIEFDIDNSHTTTFTYIFEIVGQSDLDFIIK